MKQIAVRVLPCILGISGALSCDPPPKPAPPPATTLAKAPVLKKPAAHALLVFPGILVPIYMKLCCPCLDNVDHHRKIAWTSAGFGDDVCDGACDSDGGTRSLSYQGADDKTWMMPADQDCGFFPPPAQQLPAAVDPNQLRAHLLWAVQHEGCRLYRGAAFEDLETVRACAVSKEAEPGQQAAKFHLQHATAEQFAAAMTWVANAVLGDVRNHFIYVCRTGFSVDMHAAINWKDNGGYGEIRKIFFDHENDPNKNALAGIPDSMLDDLVEHYCPPADPAMQANPKPDPADHHPPGKP